MLSDPDHAVMEAWGAWGEKSLYGKPVVGVIRSTVVVAPDGNMFGAVNVAPRGITRYIQQAASKEKRS